MDKVKGQGHLGHCILGKNAKLLKSDLTGHMVIKFQVT